MLSQFSRNELIFGKAFTDKLSKAHVAVFGLGGVGGYVVEALARAGVGKIDIIDNDTINLTNINRQIIALHSTLGQNKTDAWENRIRDINPDCIVTKHNVFYLPQNADDFDLAKYDYVIDAIDTVTAKIELAVRCSLMGVKLISSMGTGNKTDPMLFKISDIYSTKVCPLARVMRNELKKRGVDSLKVVYSEEKPINPDETALREYMEENPSDTPKSVPGSNSFVPSVAGLLIASHVVKELCI